MARVRRPRAVFSFATTADAFGMEAAAREFGIPGRTIPVPAQIDAGCGFAWRCELDEQAAVEAASAEHGLPYEAVTHVDMY